jgi:hypothetical protein
MRKIQVMSNASNSATIPLPTAFYRPKFRCRPVWEDHA